MSAPVLHQPGAGRALVGVGCLPRHPPAAHRIGRDDRAS